MAPRTEEQFAKIRSEKKVLIKQAALKLFAIEGFQNTSISMIAHSAGISKGLIYNYFESKEALIKEIIYEGMDAFLNAFDTDKDGILTGDELKSIIEESAKILKGNVNYYRLYFTIFLQPSVYELVKDRFWEIIDPTMQMIKKYFEKRGSKEPMVDTRLLLAILDGISFSYVVNPKNFPIDAVKERLIHMYAREKK